LPGHLLRARGAARRGEQRRVMRGDSVEPDA
jgi:hypothetical protein